MAFLLYTGLRLLMLVAVIGLFYALGMRGILLLVVGFVVSGLLSYLVLATPREAMAQKVSGVFGRINSRIENASKSEDELDDDVRSAANLESDVPAPDDSESSTATQVIDLTQDEAKASEIAEPTVGDAETK